MSTFVVDLSGEKKKIAEDAKNAAFEIVQDALEKNCYGLPVSFCHRSFWGNPGDTHIYCCIPTNEFLQKLLEKIHEIIFKEDTDPEESKTFAYVIPNNRDNVVYLCEEFWGAASTLCEDSQPGTIIHEVSHLLGTEDITYEYITMEVWEELYTLRGQSKMHEALLQINANSLQYEFEKIINHTQDYSDDRYQCCKETKKNSVCNERERGHYYLHEYFGKEKDEMEQKMAKFMEKLEARTSTGGRKMRYVKTKNKVCDVIPLSGP